MEFFFLSFVFVASHQLLYCFGKSLPVPLCQFPFAITTLSTKSTWFGRQGTGSEWGSSDPLHLLTLTGPSRREVAGAELIKGLLLPSIARTGKHTLSLQLEDQRKVWLDCQVLSISEPGCGKPGFITQLSHVLERGAINKNLKVQLYRL